MKDEIYVKIYTKDNNNILVLEGIKEKKEGYYYPQGSIIGTGVTGKEHISITNDAKELFKKIIIDAEKTGDDLTCLNIMKLDNGKIHVSWLGKAREEIDVRKLDEDGFFIGTGEGFPDLKLLDELTV